MSVLGDSILGRLYEIIVEEEKPDNEITLLEKDIITLTQLMYQVRNNGFKGYFENGYYNDRIWDLIKSIYDGSAKDLLFILADATKLYEDSCDDDREWDKIDKKFYQIDDDFLEMIDTFLCREITKMQEFILKYNKI